jgi:diguanylate cyclase (GGDEF)-like protein
MDLDGFKAVNDTYGHQMGDKLLVEVVRIVQSSIRKIDLFSRFGGDEFALVLSDIGGSDEALRVARKIIENINKDIIIDNKIIKVGASIGIALYPDHSTNVNVLMKLADDAMYQAKSAGKNRAVLYKDK